MKSDLCVYCGSDVNIVREHVIPASYFGHRSFDDTRQWVVEACAICNTLAGAATFFSIPEKATFILKRYRSKYAKVLRIPSWSPTEIEEMGYKLRVSIEHSLIAKTIIQHRVRHLESVTEYPRDFLRPKWVETEWREWKETQERLAKWEKARKRQVKKDRQTVV